MLWAEGKGRVGEVRGKPAGEAKTPPAAAAPGPANSEHVLPQSSHIAVVHVCVFWPLQTNSGTSVVEPGGARETGDLHRNLLFHGNRKVLNVVLHWLPCEPGKPKPVWSPNTLLLMFILCYEAECALSRA